VDRNGNGENRLEREVNYVKRDFFETTGHSPPTGLLATNAVALPVACDDGLKIFSRKLRP